MKLSNKEFIKISEAALAYYPKELCGIISEGIFIQITNIHEEPEKHFTLCPIELAEHLDKIEAVVHSHTKTIRTTELFDLRTPSYADIVGQKQTGIPWLIVGTEGVNVSRPLEIPRVRNNNYLERPFIWYINDCYSLVQDFYWFELGIDLPDHKAEKNFENIRKEHSLFEKYISEYGFIELSAFSELQEGDLVLLDTGGRVKNHLGIYTNGFILHQAALSIKEEAYHFTGRTHKVLRHVSKSI